MDDPQRTKPSSRDGSGHLERRWLREASACRPNECRICGSITARQVPRRRPWAPECGAEISKCPAKSPMVKPAAALFPSIQLKSEQECFCTSTYIEREKEKEKEEKRKRGKEDKRTRGQEDKRTRGVGGAKFNRNVFEHHCGGESAVGVLGAYSR